MDKQPIYSSLCSDILSCSSCDLGCPLLDGFDPRVTGQGCLDAKLFVCAEAPGAQETQHHQPLTPTGKSGEMFEKVLKELGLTRDQVYTTNTNKCLSGNSKILTKDGWKQIDSVVKYKYNGLVKCVDNNGNICFKKIIGWHRTLRNNRKMFKLCLTNSRFNSQGPTGAFLTEDHSVLTQRGFVEVEGLKNFDLIHSGTIRPSKQIEEAIIGMMLGDASVTKKSNSFTISHAVKQGDYLKYIAQMFDADVKSLNAICKNKKYGIKRFSLSASPFFRMLRKEWYNDTKKIVSKHNIENFSLISLAFLFMDDGYMRFRKNRNPRAEIASCAFTKKENKLIISAIKKLGIDCYTIERQGYYRIFFNNINSKILSEKIAPFVHASMNYKIFPEHRGIQKVKLDSKEIPFFDTFKAIRYKSVEKRTKFVYCIDVEEYANFITHSGVVHNCRPPRNRDPLPWETLKCRPYLVREIELIRPELIVTFGRFAALAFLRDFKMTNDQGILRKSDEFGIDMFPLYHPAYILAYAPKDKRAAFKVAVKALKQVLIERGIVNGG